MNILIADGHMVVRVGIRLLLEEWWPTVGIREADSFSELLKELSTRPLDLIMLDVNIPGGDNLRMIDQLRIKQPDAKILIFSDYDEQLYAEPYLRAGVNGYLQKNASEADIKKAIESVLNNKYYLSPNMTSHLVKQVTGYRKTPTLTPLTDLSDREIEVAHLLRMGLGTLEVSKRLNLQKSTVSTYKTRLFKKLRISNLVELIERFRLEEGCADI